MVRGAIQKNGQQLGYYLNLLKFKNFNSDFALKLWPRLNVINQTYVAGN
jgi:hypothetical protein